MKKLLSILLAIAVCVLAFAGCTNSPSPSADGSITDNQTPTLTPTDPTPTPAEPTPTPSMPTCPPHSHAIKFNLYDFDNMVILTDASKEWMLVNYELQVDHEISYYIDADLSTEDGRLMYNATVANFFSTQATRPDYIPSLRASSAGVNAAFKALANYLVDFNPYIEKGGLLYDYASDWTQYIQNLDDAEYWLVYEYYSQSSYFWQSEYVDGVKSQSTVNAQRGVNGSY